jgi:hypothetical protein
LILRKRTPLAKHWGVEVVDDKWLLVESCSLAARLG